MYRHTDIYRRNFADTIHRQHRHIEIFAHKSVALLLCVERLETQVATLSLTLID